ncbi:MAG: response regulator [Dehalococcoidia bacterium]|nr:response regulator [Dehalococcoidia bacterium]
MAVTTLRPAARPHRPARPRPCQPGNSRRTKGGSHVPHRYVLVVDDDPAVRHLMTVTLADAGVPVAGAADGQEALALVGYRVPELIFMELDLPIMDGWALAAALLTRGIEVPLVVMTGSGLGHTAARKLDAQGYLGKPFEAQDVLRLLRTLVGVTS